MSILKRLFNRKPPVPRIRICRECGMPLGEHKEWCAIVQGQQALQHPEEPSASQ